MRMRRDVWFAGALLVAVCTGASAQIEPSREGAVTTVAHVITVVGRGQVAVPPDRVRVVIRFFPRSGPGAQAVSYDTAARDLVDAIKRAGAQDARFSLPIEGSFGPSVQPAVVATVRKPTRDGLEKLARDTVSNLPDAVAPAFQNYQVSTTLQLDDCAEPEARAQTAALADARGHAERAAAAAGLRLGPVVAINEAYSFASDACRSGASVGGGGSVLSGIADPYGALEVPIAVTATVTFAIAGP